MYEKILQKLKDAREKTSSVSDKSLEDLAKTLQVFITTDELLAQANFTDTIKSLDGNISHVAAEAAKKATPKKTSEPSDTGKKPGEDVNQQQNQQSSSDEGEEKVPKWAEKLMGDIQSIKNEKVVNSRKDKLMEVLKTAPEHMSKSTVRDFSRMNFASDEEFDAYIQEVTTDRDAYLQSAKEQGLNTVAPGGNVKPVKDNGETQVLSDARELARKAKEQQSK